MRPRTLIGVGLALVIGSTVAGIALCNYWLRLIGFWSGVASLSTGLFQRERQLERDRESRAEAKRARKEWSELEQILREEHAKGGSPSHLLQQRGYREFHVRRWILRELQLR